MFSKQNQKQNLQGFTRCCSPIVEQKFQFFYEGQAFISRVVSSKTFHLKGSPFQLYFQELFRILTTSIRQLAKIWQKSTNSSVRVLKGLLVLLVITVYLSAHWKMATCICVRWYLSSVQPALLSAITWKAYWSWRPLQEFSFLYSVLDGCLSPPDWKSLWLRRNKMGTVSYSSSRFAFFFVKEQNSLWYL